MIMLRDMWYKYLMVYCMEKNKVWTMRVKHEWINDDKALKCFGVTGISIFRYDFRWKNEMLPHVMTNINVLLWSNHFFYDDII